MQDVKKLNTKPTIAVVDGVKCSETAADQRSAVEKAEDLFGEACNDAGVHYRPLRRYVVEWTQTEVRAVEVMAIDEVQALEFANDIQDDDLPMWDHVDIDETVELVEE